MQQSMLPWCVPATNHVFDDSRCHGLLCLAQLDENNFTADELQNLIYCLCYTYAHVTRALPTVPAVYYAQILAVRYQVMQLSSLIA